jgi:hypothetical protein
LAAVAVAGVGGGRLAGWGVRCRALRVFADAAGLTGGGDVALAAAGVAGTAGLTAAATAGGTSMTTTDTTTAFVGDRTRAGTGLPGGEPAHAPSHPALASATARQLLIKIALPDVIDTDLDATACHNSCRRTREDPPFTAASAATPKFA